MTREIQYRLDSMDRAIPEPNIKRWAEWLAQYRREGRHVVQRDELVVEGVRVIVSSIFLGSDVAMSGPPLLYETMVFGGVLSGMRARWSSRAMATFGSGILIGYVVRRASPETVREKIVQLIARSDAFAEGEPDSIQRGMHGVDEREAVRR